MKANKLSISILILFSLYNLSKSQIAFASNKANTRADYNLYDNTNSYLKNYFFDDWIASDCSKSICCGKWSEPFYKNKNADNNKFPFELSADNVHFDLEGDSLFSGNVELTKGNLSLIADKAIVRKDSKKEISEILAIGNVKLNEPGFRLDGSEIRVYPNDNFKTIFNAHYRIYDRESYGFAKNITAIGDEVLILNNASYTTCSPINPTWVLKTNKVRLNKKTGRGSAKHSVLYLKKVPVFYSPYLSFPINKKRKTGFLYPNVGVTRKSGTFIKIPYYFNLAPNYDWTFTPTYYSKRGMLLNNELRYLTKKSSGEIIAEVLPNDREYRQFKQDSREFHPTITNPLDPRLKGLQNHSLRYAFSAKHLTVFNKHTNAGLFYNKVSDDNYFSDIANNINSSNQTHLEQTAFLGLNTANINSELKFEKYQVLHPFEGPITSSIYERVPSFNLSMSFLDLPFGFEFEGFTDISYFNHKRVALNQFNRPPIGIRTHVHPSIALGLYRPGYYIRPRVGFDVINYKLNLNSGDALRYEKNATRTVPVYDIDAGAFFDKNLTINDKKYTHTLEPRIYYLNVPYREHSRLPIFDTSLNTFSFNQLFRNNRFTGSDRFGDADQLSLAFSTRLTDQESGQQKVMLSVGQIFYNKNRSVAPLRPFLTSDEFDPNTTKKSPIIAESTINFNRLFTANLHAEYIPQIKKLDKSLLLFTYKPTKQAAFSFNYVYYRKDLSNINPITLRPESLRQIQASALIPISRKYRFIGNIHYDLKRELSHRTVVGIEYTSCCLAFDLVYSRYLMPSSLTNLATIGKKHSGGIFFQIIFKGLGEIGQDGLKSSLTSIIPGYKRRNHNDI